MRFHGGTRVLAVIGALVLLLALPLAASAYTSRRAAPAERAAILRDARLTQPCGYAGSGRLSPVRVVSYTARGVSFKWGAVLWTPSGPDAQGCVLVFLHAAGYDFHSVETPKHATVGWLAFTWGSSPFDNQSYLSDQWRHLDFAAGSPNWIVLDRALVFPLFQ